MPLNAPAITELSIETAALTLWQEFLAGYFNNATHAVGVNAAVLFPAVTLRFQQSALPQPLNGVGMSVVWVRPSRTRYAWETVYVGAERQRQQMAYAHCSFMFWVRAELVEAGGGNATSKCRDAAQLLFGLLQNSAATRPLAQKGIHRLRPENPQLVSEGGGGGRTGDAAYSTRLLNCSAMIHYPVLSQLPQVSTPTFEAPFDTGFMTLACATPGASIYWIDEGYGDPGPPPNPSNLYAGTVNIGLPPRLITIIAVKDGFQPSAIVARLYVGYTPP